LDANRYQHSDQYSHTYRYLDAITNSQQHAYTDVYVHAHADPYPHTPAAHSHQTAATNQATQTHSDTDALSLLLSRGPGSDGRGT
jgi:hypothetical protein